MKLKSLYLLIFVFVTLAVFAGLGDYYQWIGISSSVLAATRWIVWGLLIYLAYLRKSLTPWIVVGMFLGCEIGFSFPKMAVHLDVLSGIFLRLIKTIIAPLIFSTLVVGIAAHSNLKQVGRMGLKALIYFELVTT
ncbi:MAG TPA: cation:dicarboxylase symporter family transporter, partial [Cyclobacteriaceae bacterium]|nr:cation:dicarboxylase symporter family transporter [Cyclobacteriaceae bacterium]